MPRQHRRLRQANRRAADQPHRRERGEIGLVTHRSAGHETERKVTSPDECRSYTRLLAPHENLFTARSSKWLVSPDKADFIAAAGDSHRHPRLVDGAPSQ
jgi:hypothetical protein